MNLEIATLLQLLRVSLGISGSIELSCTINWAKVMNLSIMHGVHGVAFDAFEKLPAECRPSKDVFIRWAAHCLLLEDNYNRQWNVANKLVGFFEEKGIELTILKGFSFAQYYANPKHRYSCDLDLFIEKGWDEACKILESKGIELEREVYKEVEFYIDNVYVECHRCITPFRGHRILQKFELYIRELLHTDKKYFDNSRLICPSIMFSVMLFIEHALGDFLHGKLMLKHVVDWIVLRKQNLDWDEVEKKMIEFKFERFYQLINYLADVVEGKVNLESLPLSSQQVFKEIFSIKTKVNQERSWFKKRIFVFFDIINNKKRFQEYGYCSMYSFLFNSLYTHFIKKEVKLSYN